MKKIGKKISYLAKVFLATSLLFNNLSSLSIVFADEVTDDEVVVGETVDEDTQVLDDETTGEDTDLITDEVETDLENADNDENYGSPDETTSEEEGETTQFLVTVNDEQVIIKYTGALELAEDVKLVISEDFKYLDDTTYGELTNEIELTDDVRNALVSENGYLYDSEMLLENSFNGTYSVRVVIGEEERTETNVFNETAEGMDFDLLYMTSGDLPEGEGYMPVYNVAEANEEGKYVIPTDATEVLVVGWLNPSGITPSMTFTYNGIEYSAQEMFWGTNLEIIDFADYLHGEFTQNIVIESSNGKTYSKSFPIIYGEYQDNTDKLNESAKNVGLDDTYLFFGDSENGTVYVLGEAVLDEVEDIIKDAIGESEVIEYTTSLENDLLIITLTDLHGVKITYQGAKLSRDTKIDARLDMESTDISSGDTFTVNYVVTLKDYAINGVGGLVSYDEGILKLTSVEASNFSGNNVDGKFVYVGSDAIGGVIDDETGTVAEAEYVVLTLTFEALTAGTSTITIEESKFFNEAVYYEASGEISTEVIVNESSNNDLSTLTIGGQNIELQEDVLEYEITVPNDVTTANIEAIAKNSNAKISYVEPSELAIGENTITITVTAEDGNEKVYTIKVIREGTEEAENTATVSPVNYQEPVISDDDDQEPAIIDNDDDKKEKDDEAADTEKDGKLSRIIIIILILLVVAGLIYLIFKDDEDEEAKKANKEIDKLKKENDFKEKPSNKVNNNKNKKKER